MPPTGYIPKDLCKANLFHWPRLSLQILKNPTTNSCGHGIKDIEIHVCLPSVKITASAVSREEDAGVDKKSCQGGGTPQCLFLSCSTPLLFNLMLGDI